MISPAEKLDLGRPPVPSPATTGKHFEDLGRSLWLGGWSIQICIFLGAVVVLRFFLSRSLGALRQLTALVDAASSRRCATRLTGHGKLACLLIARGVVQFQLEREHRSGRRGKRTGKRRTLFQLWRKRARNGSVRQCHRRLTGQKRSNNRCGRTHCLPRLRRPLSFRLALRTVSCLKHSAKTVRACVRPTSLRPPPPSLALSLPMDSHRAGVSTPSQ